MPKRKTIHESRVQQEMNTCQHFNGIQNDELRIAARTDQQWAEELWSNAIEDYPLGDAIGFQSAALRILAEVRHQEREACAKEVPTSWLDSSLSGPDAVLSSKSAGRWGCPDIERLLKAIQNRIRSRKDD